MKTLANLRQYDALNRFARLASRHGTARCVQALVILKSAVTQATRLGCQPVISPRHLRSLIHQEWQCAASLNLVGTALFGMQ